MKRHTLIRGLNILGYMALYVQWMWLIMLFIPTIIDSGLLAPPTDEAPTPVVVPPASGSGIEPLYIIGAIVLAVAAFALTVYAIMKSPGVVTDAGEKTTARIANAALPLFTHRKKLSKRRQFQLSLRLQYYLKLILSLLAFLLLFATSLIDSPLPLSVTVTIGLILLPWAMLWFTLAYVFTRR